MESILGGYEDPRVSVTLNQLADAHLVLIILTFLTRELEMGHNYWQKTLEFVMSTISENFKDVTHRRFFDAAEVHFMLAEANLRGWSTPLSAQAHYEAGVNLLLTIGVLVELLLIWLTTQLPHSIMTILQ